MPNSANSYELNRLLGTIFENWRIFDLLGELATIDAKILPWIYTLWFQIGFLALALVVVLVLLKRESYILNQEVLDARKEDLIDEVNGPEKSVMYIAGLHDVAADYYRTKQLVC